MLEIQPISRRGVLVPALAALALAVCLQPGVATAQASDDVVSARRSRIAVDLKVRPVGSYLTLYVSFYNPHRCHWFGHLFLERDDLSGAVRTLGRGYDVTIPAGDRLKGIVIVVRPPSAGPHLFVARAYHADGEDEEPYFSVDDVGPPGGEASPAEGAAEFEVGDEVLDASFDLTEGNRPDRPGDEAPCDGEAGPIQVELSLTPDEPDIEVMGRFSSTARTPWRGDVYVDVVGPAGGVQVVRRDLGVLLRPGVGFSTWDRVPQPGPPGLYLFTARALRRDGSSQVRWFDPGTTEITAVCNRDLCELITPDQDRADIVLTGESEIVLESDFFSEFTTVRMAYETVEYDITDLCEISQFPAGPRNHVSVRFDSFELPIGPRTWARYTIELHPMPTVPEGAKLSDSIWVLTNGPE